MTLEFDQGTLLLSPAGLPEEVVPSCFVKDARSGGRYRAIAMTYRQALTHLIRSGCTVDDRARQYAELELPPGRDRKPYPHQQEALDAWEAAGKRGMVILPTGAGKTFVAELAIARVARSTLVIVPTLDLVAQWATVLEEAFGQPVGMIGGGSFDVQPLTVSTYDSAYLHMERLGDKFGLIVFDEAHHLPSEAYAQAAELAIAPFRLGLTATMERTDGGHDRLTGLVGPVVCRKTVTELSGRYLSDYEIIRVDVELTPEERTHYDEERAVYRAFVTENGIRMGSGQGWQNFIQLSSRSAAGRRAFQAYQNQRRQALCSASKLLEFEKILKRHSESRILYFAHDNKTVYDISKRFLVPVITHETPTSERKQILAGLSEGRWRVVGTSRALNEGVDIPDVSVGIILSGTGSVRDHVQRLGRILRRREGKEATLYELVTAETIDTFTSDRRREHEAYR